MRGWAIPPGSGQVGGWGGREAWGGADAQQASCGHGAEAPAGRSEAPSTRDAASDPWSLLTLADRLAQQGGRQDELVAVLVAAMEEPATRQDAADRLLRLTEGEDTLVPFTPAARAGSSR